MINKLSTTQGGYVVILNTLIFVVVSTFITYALAAPLLSSNRATGELLHSKRAFVAANSTTEEVLYKMKKNYSVPTSETITLGDVSTTASVASTFSGRTVSVSANDENVSRSLRVDVAESTGVSFNYGMQTGRGGFELYGGAQVFGNIYSNGTIIGYGGAYVSGSVVSASGLNPIVHQSNSGPAIPTHSLIFGGQLVSNDQKPQDFAQSFTVSTTTPVSAVRLYLRKYADVWMNDTTVRIVNNTSNRPGNTTLASATLQASQVTTSYNYLTLPFTSQVVLTPGTTYWLVLDTSNTWNSYYMLAANLNGYSNGVARFGEYGNSSWSNPNPSNLDAYFDLYIGGEAGGVQGMPNNRLSVDGDVWARNVSGVNANGILYCQGASYTNKTCNISRPDPVQQPLPISDGNIETWKTEAEAGGVHNGNLTVGNWPTQHVTMEARKINGNLVVTSGGSLTVSGTLWVTGNITVEGGAVVKLANSYGSKSGVIVTDGRMVATGGGKFEGNNVSGNYILLVSNSTCPTGNGCGGNPAMTLDGGAGAVILNAQKGVLRITGGAKAKQATAEKIIMDGGTQLNYETGLMDMSFNSGPSGSWSISRWSEI